MTGSIAREADCCSPQAGWFDHYLALEYLRTIRGINAMERRYTRRELLGTGVLTAAGLCLPEASAHAEEYHTIDFAGKPVTGFIMPGLEGMDKKIVQYMHDYEIPTGSFALTKDGRLLAVRAYGYYDAECTRPLTPVAMFRMASLDKMIIRTAIGLLIEMKRRTPVTDELITRDLRIFRTLKNAGIIGKRIPIEDPRLLEVTIGQMIDHTSGIAIEYPAISAVRESLGLHGMPDQLDFLRWHASRRLETDPGAVEKYNNTANVLLWYSIHWLTGNALNFLQQQVFPSGISSEVALSRTRSKDRLRSEVWYSTKRMAPSIYPEDEGKQLPVTDGGRDLYDYAMIASARALVLYCDRWYMGLGVPLFDRPGHLAKDNGWTIYNGSWDGVSSTMFQRRWSLCNAALLFNHREERDGIKPTDMAEMLVNVIEPLGW
jgi:hypothetical protein